VLPFILLLATPYSFLPFPVSKTALVNEQYSLVYIIRRAVNLYTMLRSTMCESGDLEDLESIHDHPLHLVHPGLLRAVGETSYGIWVGFIGSTYRLHYLFTYLFVKSTPIQLRTQKPYFHNRKENSRRFPLVLLTTPYTTSLTPLACSTAKVSHPIPLSAANRFLGLNLSVDKSYHLSTTVLE